MALNLRLDLDDELTFEKLYRFVDHARSAGVAGDQAVTVLDIDDVGNDLGVYALTADLGEVDELTRPVLINSALVSDYAAAISRTLTQESDKSDNEALGALLRDLTRS